MIDLALIGVGAWGRRYADTVGRRTDCRLVAYARAPESPDAAFDGASPVRVPDWRAVLDLAARPGGPKGILVATSPRSQAEIALAALAREVPAVIEKPLGTTSSEAQAIAAAAACANRPVLLVDFIHLWSAPYRALKLRVEARLQRGDAVVAIETEGSNRGPFRSFSSLLDYGPHDVALCLDLLGLDAPFALGDSRRLRGEPGSQAGERGELFVSHFRLGATAVRLTCGNGALTKTRRFTVTFASGSSLVYDDTLPLGQKLREDEEPVPLEARTPLDALLSDFLLAIGAREEALSTTNLPLAVRVAQILDALAAAAPSSS